MPRKQHAQLIEVDPETLEPITLPSGSTLDKRQTIAATLKAIGQHDDKQIAAMAGYASVAVLQTFLRSKKGQEGVGQATRQRLSGLGARALQTKAELMESKATHPELRNQIASEIMALAGIRPPAQQAGDAGSEPARSVNVNIQLGPPADQAKVTGPALRNVTPEGGGGEN